MLVKTPRLLIALLLCLAGIAVQTTAAATSPPQTIHLYQTGKNVGGLQWMGQGHRPSVYKIVWWHHRVNGVYDKRLAHAVRNMKWRLGYPTSSLDGTHASATFIAYLKGTERRPMQYRVRAGNRVIALAKKRHDLAHPPLSAKVKVLVADANYLIAHRNLVNYSQVVRMQIVREHIHLPPLTRTIYEDCSSSTTGLYWLAGLPDPNGLGYNGYGFTGTQSAHGRVVWHLGEPLSQLRAGDLIFYGGGWPHHHVTMYKGNGRVFSHGTNTGPFDLPVNYRNDAVGAHRYVVSGA